MNSPNRLLFAAARGARIENQQGLSQKYLWLKPFDNDLLRVHPDDEHLAYGPISTELRSLAANNYVVQHKFIPPIVLDVVLITPYADRWMLTWREQTRLERSLALLTLAEALADEGL